MSQLVDTIVATASATDRGLVTGDPQAPQRQAWAQVHKQARQVAHGLVADGLRPGGSVALLAAEPAWIAPAVQGVWLAGGSVTMLHQPTPRTQLADWVRDTLRALDLVGADVVLLDTSFAAVAAELAGHRVRYRMLADMIGTAGTAGTSDTAADATVVPVPTGEHDIALLQLTSGTTALPKAVRITHGNLLANIVAMAERGHLDPGEDVMMSWLPLFHDMGMIAFMALPMTLGLELVKLTPGDFLGAPLVWPTLLARFSVTITGAPNFGYALLRKQLATVQDPAAFDLSALRIALNGAEPIDEAVVRGLAEAGARFGLRSDCMLAAYGLAEATLAVSAASPSGGLRVDVVDSARLDAGVAAPAEPGSATRTFSRLGMPLRGVKVAVLGPDGTRLGERQIGELMVRGESVTPGYLTVEGPVDAHDEEGWLHTGDLGYLADGEVVVCGRSKDVIIMAGRNIYPTDIERAAASVDGVRAGNVAAVRIDAGSRREGFAIVLESRYAGDTDAELALSRQVVAQVIEAVDARPVTVRVVPPGSLSKTPSGKLRRAEAAMHLAAGQTAAGTPEPSVSAV
ncbi:fatty acyl-AMP ligase [Streptomyces mirabilis]|uniref:fatty acyl-AMP ligase n=1 Tax=Streptomyces mirabilis TaxID=68239 RepID=UPI00332D4ADC